MSLPFPLGERLDTWVGIQGPANLPLPDLSLAPAPRSPAFHPASLYGSAELFPVPFHDLSHGEVSSWVSTRPHSRAPPPGTGCMKETLEGRSVVARMGWRLLELLHFCVWRFLFYFKFSTCFLSEQHGSVANGSLGQLRVSLSGDTPESMML